MSLGSPISLRLENAVLEIARMLRELTGLDRRPGDIARATRRAEIERRIGIAQSEGIFFRTRLAMREWENSAGGLQGTTQAELEKWLKESEDRARILQELLDKVEITEAK